MTTKKRTTKKQAPKKQPTPQSTWTVTTDKSWTAAEAREFSACKRESSPIIVHVPEEIRLKTRAICDLCSAIKSLAEALESTNCTVTIDNCHISASPETPGISISKGM